MATFHGNINGCAHIEDILADLHALQQQFIPVPYRRRLSLEISCSRLLLKTQDVADVLSIARRKDSVNWIHHFTVSKIFSILPFDGSRRALSFIHALLRNLLIYVRGTYCGPLNGCGHRNLRHLCAVMGSFEFQARLNALLVRGCIRAQRSSSFFKAFRDVIQTEITSSVASEICAVSAPLFSSGFFENNSLTDHDQSQESQRRQCPPILKLTGRSLHESKAINFCRDLGLHDEDALHSSLINIVDEAFLRCTFYCNVDRNGVRSGNRAVVFISALPSDMVLRQFGGYSDDDESIVSEDDSDDASSSDEESASLSSSSLSMFRDRMERQAMQTKTCRAAPSNPFKDAEQIQHQGRRDATFVQCLRSALLSALERIRCRVQQGDCDVDQRNSSSPSLECDGFFLITRAVLRPEILSAICAPAPALDKNTMKKDLCFVAHGVSCSTWDYTLKGFQRAMASLWSPHLSSLAAILTDVDYSGMTSSLLFSSPSPSHLQSVILMMRGCPHPAAPASEYFSFKTCLVTLKLNAQKAREPAAAGGLQIQTHKLSGRSDLPRKPDERVDTIILCGPVKEVVDVHAAALKKGLDNCLAAAASHQDPRYFQQYTDGKDSCPPFVVGGCGWPIAFAWECRQSIIEGRLRRLQTDNGIGDCSAVDETDDTQFLLLSLIAESCSVFYEVVEEQYRSKSQQRQSLCNAGFTPPSTDASLSWWMQYVALRYELFAHNEAGVPAIYVDENGKMHEILFSDEVHGVTSPGEKNNPDLTDLSHTWLSIVSGGLEVVTSLVRMSTV